jgi:hypothetical protein
MAREKPPENAGLPDKLRLGRNRRSLWRLGAWGAAAGLSLASAALVAQSGPGKERLQQALAGIVPTPTGARTSSAAAQPAEAKPQLTAEQAEIRDMTERLHTLVADHDHLEQRVASLEQHLDTVTGALQRQPAGSKEEATLSPDAKPSTSSAPAVEPPQALPHIPTVPAPKQIIAVPASLSVASAAPVDIAPSVPRPGDAPAMQANEEATRSEHPATEDVKLPALVRLPPRRAPLHRAASHPLFGVDLGTATSVDEVKAQWAAIKANFGPILTGLDSVPAPNSRPDQGPYRLVIGPLPNMKAAHDLCSQFAVGHVACQPVELGDRQFVRR